MISETGRNFKSKFKMMHVEKTLFEGVGFCKASLVKIGSYFKVFNTTVYNMVHVELKTKLIFILKQKIISMKQQSQQ